MKKAWQFLLGIFFSVMLTMFFCILLVVLFFGRSYAEINRVSVEKMAEGLTHDAGGYELDGIVQIKLQEAGGFAFLLNASGERVWGIDVPDEIATQFTLQEVASFSRWYLNGYPVFTWQYEDGLLVLGYPKSSIWKYLMVMPESQVTSFFLTIPPMWFCSLVLIFLIEYLWDQWYRKKNEKSRVDWIAGVSHDLRTPLTTIMGYSAQLAADESLSGKARDELQVIVKQTEVIRGLSQDFNLVNRLQYGKYELKKQEIRPAALVRGVVAQILNVEQTHRYNVEVEIAPEAEQMVCKWNAHLVERAIGNIVRNSMTHNPRGCNIDITMLKKGKRVRIVIHDYGQGYPEDIRKRLHRKQRYLEHHGLGLLIADRIIQLHHGKMQLYNDKGAVTVMEL